MLMSVNLNQKRGSTSDVILLLALTMFLMSASTKWLKESMCCLTRPLTLRKAGRRSHLSCGGVVQHADHGARIA